MLKGIVFAVLMVPTAAVAEDVFDGDAEVFAAIRGVQDAMIEYRPGTNYEGRLDGGYVFIYPVKDDKLPFLAESIADELRRRGDDWRVVITSTGYSVEFRP